MEYETPHDYRTAAGLATARTLPEWFPEPEGTALNLGAGSKHIKGAIPLDLPDWNADIDPIPYKDGEVSAIYAIHFLEHIGNPVSMLRECQRVLKHGGVLNVVLPYYSSQIAIHDLDHKSFWCEDTWKHLFANDYYDKEHKGWEFRIHTNFIFGLAERNMMLITQLIRN